MSFRAARSQVERFSGLAPLLLLAIIALQLASSSEGLWSGGFRPPQGWQRVFPSFGAAIHDLLRDPDNPQVIYAACSWQSLSPTEQTGGVLRSNDHGISWVEANQGMPRDAEVLALAVVPPGFAGESPALLAGTRRAGLYLSGDGGNSWQQLPGSLPFAAERQVVESTRAEQSGWERLTVQTLVALPDVPPAVAIGTMSHGVLVSTDAGASWEEQSYGLSSLNIQALVLDSEGALLAGTWYGGVFRSEDRGRQWTRIYPGEKERVVVSALTMSGDTLWVGLQNGDLYARSLTDQSAPFVAEGKEFTESVGILAIRSAGRQVVVGTGGMGTLIGERGGAYTLVDDGLDNKAVSAVLLPDPDGPGEILIGTWGGLYRSIPRSWAVPVALGAALGAALYALASLAAVTGFRAWQHSVPAAAGAIYHRLGDLVSTNAGTSWEERSNGLSSHNIPALAFDSEDALLAGRRYRGAFRSEDHGSHWTPRPVKVLEYLGREMARHEPARGRAVLDRLAKRLARAESDPRACLADLVRITAKLRGIIDKAEGPVDAEVRDLLAGTLDRRAVAMETLAERWTAGEDLAGGENICRAIAIRDRFFGALLRADSPGHVAALQPDLATFESSEVAEAAPFLDNRLFRDLHGILDALEHLGRLPSAEDRALFLGRALTQLLEARERLAERRARRPSVGMLLGTVVLHSLGQLLQTALQDIRQRAVLDVKLRSRVLTARRETVVVLEIRNTGQGHARNVAVELLPAEESFRIVQPRQETKSLLRNQSARLEFLVEPQAYDRVRLTFRISYADLERQEQYREFADVVEFRQVESRRTYRPLHPNPYVVGRPLTTEDLFIGREEVFDRIASNLKGAHQDNVVALIGQRRMGKTSILRRLHLHLGDDYVPVLVDLQGMLGDGEISFFRDLADTICDEFEELGLGIEPPELDVDPGRIFRRHFLRDVRRALGGRRLLLMFDEFEVFEERIRSGTLSARILPYFRSLMQHEKGVSFMLTGTHRLDELTGDYWGVLFNLAIYFEVGNLHQGEVVKLLTEPTRDFFEIDPLALDKVYQLTGGHPHISQLVARVLVDLRNRKQLSYVTVQDVNAVADRVGEKGQLHISYLWADASRGERLLLLVIKELLEREGLATITAAHRYLSERRIDHGDLPTAARQLIHKEILNENAGQLSFHMELLRLWIERHHNIESFMLSSDRVDRKE